MISVSSVPESLRNDRSVAPFIARSAELAEVNPVVSYYCKLYVLEHILSQKLHQTGKDVEAFTVSLLDDTENTKASDDESVRHVLGSKQLSINLVFVFAFKLYNSCLEDLGQYDGVSKARLAQKLRATINFWSLFPLFAGDTEDPIDYAKTSGGQCASEEQFLAFTKDKIKTLKYQLSRLLKDEVPVKGEEQELEELGDLAGAGNSPEESATDNISKSGGESNENKAPAGDIAGASTDFEDPSDSPGQGFSLPSAPQKDPKLGSESEDENTGTPFTLPGAPKFDPSANSDAEDTDLHLPGAPKLLPDDDLSHVNKKSSIHVFQPKGPNPGEVVPKSAPPKAPQRSASNTVHVTRESVHTIVDTTEQIGKIQKHAKFAISALNYEDFSTAEAELVKGLEMLRSIRGDQ